MKRINLFWIIWIFVTLESKDVACVSYPGVYRNELPVIVPGASPIENVFVTERYGINYECIETCYPILNPCDDKCSVMPGLPECLHCQRLPPVPPTPIIIETPPYEPMHPSFEHPETPIVSYPSRLPRPPMFPKPPSRPIFPQPSRPIIPEIPRPPKFEEFELVPPTPILPDIPQPLEPETFQPVPLPPEVGNFETELPPQVTVPDVPHIFENFQPELPPRPILPDFPHAPQLFENFQPELPPRPLLPVVPRPPQLETEVPPQPNLPEIPRPPQLVPVEPTIPEIPLPPTPIVPEFPQMEIFPQIDTEREPEFPPTTFPFVPLPPRYEGIDEVFPSITVYEPPQVPTLQPIFPEIPHPTIVQIPNPVSPERPIIVATYPENVLYPETTLYIPEIPPSFDNEGAGVIVDRGQLQPPIVNEYRDICTDYCLLKRNISECEICLKTGVPADHLELCSNCLINPSDPDCQLCYPILLNLCREFCIFEENEPDCSSCYPQPLVEVPIILGEDYINMPAPELTEYIPIIPRDICPEFCALRPTSPECDGCGIGVEVIEKVCVDICSGYCLDHPNDEQCAVCYTTDVIENYDLRPPELPTLEIINYQCCYGDYCTAMPRNGICPVVCKELCTTACSNDCFNPTCPDCQELVALNEYRRTQFMIWLKSKLSDMKSRYMAMIEACIRRTEFMYERELQAIEMEVDTSLQLA